MYNIFTSGRLFEWDENKNFENQKKHGVPFLEAKSVFFDDRGREKYDLDHSAEEDRFLLLGLSECLRLLVVCYCYRRKYSMIRIISARKANKLEEQLYWRKYQ